MAIELILPFLLMQQVIVEVRYGNGTPEPVPNAEVTMYRDGVAQRPTRPTNNQGRARFSPVRCTGEEQIRFSANVGGSSDTVARRRDCREPVTPLKVYD